MRLAAQGLTRPIRASASDLVHYLGAVQAQDYAGAKWALGQRTGETDAAIEGQLDEGRILRTHVLRPTWHFVAPADIRWMLKLTAPRVTQAMASYNRKLGLTAGLLRRSNSVIARALAGGRHLTRGELKAALGRARVPVPSAQVLGHMMLHAELAAVICSGPRRGNQFTYALFEQRVPAAPERERDDALREIALRYFRARGPASAQDFAWWSGLTAADVRRAIEIAGPGLERTLVNERPHWLAADRVPLPPRKPSAFLLPNYDEYFIGFKDRTAIAQRLGHAGLVTGGNFLINHVVVLDGQLAGGWRRLVEAGAVHVRLELITPVSAAERGRLRRTVRRLGEFLGVSVSQQEGLLR
jgi:hypothetical protein